MTSTSGFITNRALHLISYNLEIQLSTTVCDLSIDK